MKVKVKGNDTDACFSISTNMSLPLPIVFPNEGETHFSNKIDGDENNSIFRFYFPLFFFTATTKIDQQFYTRKYTLKVKYAFFALNLFWVRIDVNATVVVVKIEKLAAADQHFQ